MSLNSSLRVSTRTWKVLKSGVSLLDLRKSAGCGLCVPSGGKSVRGGNISHLRVLGDGSAENWILLLKRVLGGAFETGTCLVRLGQRS